MGNERKRSSDNISPLSVQSKCSSISPPVAKQIKYHSPPFNPVQSRPQEFSMSAPNVTVTPQNSIFAAEQSQLRGIPGNGPFNPPIPPSLMMQRSLTQLPGMNPADLSSLLTSAAAAGRTQGFDQVSIASQIQGFLPRPSNPQNHSGLPMTAQIPQLSPAAAAAAAAFGAQSNPNNLFDPHNSLLMRSAMIQQLYQRVASGNNAFAPADPRTQIPTSLAHSPTSTQQMSPSLFPNPYLANQAVVSNASQVALNNKLSEFSPTGKVATSIIDSDFLLKNLTLPLKTSPNVATETELASKLKDFRS